MRAYFEERPPNDRKINKAFEAITKRKCLVIFIYHLNLLIQTILCKASTEKLIKYLKTEESDMELL